MNRFQNKTCPVCREKIKESDEVVVCPECGTPHHRACYFVKNKCALKFLHGEFEWQGKLPDELIAEEEAALNEQDAHSVKIITIGADGKTESETDVPLDENEFTNHIYELIKKRGKDDLSSPPEFESELDEQIYKELSDMMTPTAQLLSNEVNPLYFELMTRRMADSKKGKDGVSMRELVYYSTSSYMHYEKCFTFCMMGTIKPSINIGAALLYPIHQFYRKMSGLAAAIIMFMLFTEGLPLLLHKLSIIGDSFRDTLLVVGGALSVVLTILLALYNDVLYYKHCVRQIRKVRKRFEGKTDTIEYYHELTNCGKPSLPLALLGLLVLLFVRVFIAVILTR